MSAVFDLPWGGSVYNPATPLDIGAIETAIVTRLSATIEQVEVTHYPDRPETYRLTHRIGAALVRYDGATYGPLIDSAAVVQKRELQFAVRLLVRDLGWSYAAEDTGLTPGAYSLMESIRRCLTGFQIPGCSKMYPTKERFVERDKQGGVWVYESIFRCDSVAVEPSSPCNYPLFVYGSMQERGGETLGVAEVAQYTFDEFDQIQLAQGNIGGITVSGGPGGPIYTVNTDYTVDIVTGVVARAAGGAIAAGGTVSIAYSYSEVVIAQAGGSTEPTAPTN
jgi:hypothetical protein